MADRDVIGIGAPMAGLVALILAIAACGDHAEDRGTSAEWVAEVTTRLEADQVEDDVTDCVLNVARVELERNPLSDAATDELVDNCEAARAVIDGSTDTEEQPVTELASTDTPNRPGDDPTLDAMWAACEGGSGVACNQLFAAAPIGSEYEEFGVTCGARPDVLHCEELDLVEPDQD